MAAISIYLIVFRLPRFVGSGLTLPLLIIWASSAGYGVAAAGLHFAVQYGDPTLAWELARVTILVSALGAPAFIQLICKYPRRLTSRWVSYGVSLLYVDGCIIMALAGSHLLIVGNTFDASGHPITAMTALWELLQIPSALALVACIVWLGYLWKTNRTNMERRGALGLLLAAAPPIVFYVILSVMGIDTGPSNVFEPGSVIFLWWTAVLALVLASGRLPSPVPSAIDSVISAVTDGVLIVDAEGTVVRSNTSARTLLGMTESALQGCPVSEMFGRALEDPEASKPLTMVTMGVLRGRMDSHQQNVAGVGPRRLSCHLQVLPLGLRGSSKEVPGAILLFEDATERIALADATKRTTDLQDLVIRVLGHDLKAPLAVIQGYVDLGKARLSGSPKAEDVEKARSDLDKIAEAAAGMLIQMSNARAISAITTAASGTIRTRDTDLSGLVRQTAAQMRPLAAARRITIEEDVAQGARALVVPGFESVVRNLVDNAIKYSAPGGVVSVRLAGGEKIVMEVSDTGGGIPMEVRDRLFRKFDRLGAEGGKVEGQGLGLSIVSSLVAFSGGKVTVGDRTDGKSGAVFTVELPVGKAPAPA